MNLTIVNRAHTLLNDLELWISWEFYMWLLHVGKTPTRYRTTPPRR